MRNITLEHFYRTLTELSDGVQYLQLMDLAKSRDCTEIRSYEVHHIFPVSLGGSDDSVNKVRLTVYEHCLAHLLLAKCFSYPETYYVLNRMSGRKFDQMTDLEKVTLEEVFGWSQKRSAARDALCGKRVSVHDPKTGRTLRVLKEEVSEYLDDGYVQGIPERRKDFNRNINKGRITVSNDTLGISKMVHESELSGYLKSGWYRGMLHSLKQSLQGKIPVNRDGEEKHVSQEKLQQYLADGWCIGTSEKQRLNHGKAMKGKVRLFLEDKGIMVSADKVDSYLAKGWKRGRSGTYYKAIRGRVTVNRDGHFKRVSKEQADLMVRNEGYFYGTGMFKKSR